MELMLGILIVAVLVLLIVLGIQLKSGKDPKRDMRYLLMESEKRQQETLFRLQQDMNHQLTQFQQLLVSNMKSDLQTLNDATTNRLFSIEKQVNEHLQHGYAQTNDAFGKVMEQMGKLDESQKNLKELSLSIGTIQHVLTDKKTRGIFGEVTLYHLLENAFGLNQKLYGKQVKLSNQMMVDAVIYGKEPCKMICIDSKFPLENYNRIMDAESKEQSQRYHQQFVNDVKKHIKVIGEKYIIPNETAEFAYLFLPAEAIFSYIYSTCDEIVTYSYERKVYIVSPTTLMAYITAIQAIYLGIDRNENMMNIQQELKNLQIEFERFEKRSANVQHDFEKCYQDMNQLMITANKLTQRFHDIEAVKLS